MAKSSTFGDLFWRYVNGGKMPRGKAWHKLMRTHRMSWEKKSARKV
ncbi:TPA: hypothetical protein R1156_003038 [Yersinia enterocolitica]|nr:hypothetical protein [Yersinia enterocolitica]HEI6964560.1 hypothetical protein [Yersinia enterocolitica]